MCAHLVLTRTSWASPDPAAPLPPYGAPAGPYGPPMAPPVAPPDPPGRAFMHVSVLAASRGKAWLLGRLQALEAYFAEGIAPVGVPRIQPPP